MVKKIDGYDYTINTNGDVVNIKTNKVLKHCLGSNGYYHVTLYKDKKPKMFSVHRLLAISFIPNENNKLVVNHIDENKMNNSIYNLEWCSYSENTNHNNANLRIKNTIIKQRGIKGYMINLTSGLIEYFTNIKELECYGLSSSKISLCLNGKRNKHKGYRFIRMKEC